MNEPVSKAYIVPNDCPPDIEMMAIWAQAFGDYSDRLNGEQMRAAMNWFAHFVANETEKA